MIVLVRHGRKPKHRNSTPIQGEKTLSSLFDRTGNHETKEFILVDTNRSDHADMYKVVAVFYVPKFKVTMTGRPVTIGGDFLDACRIVTALNVQLKSRLRKAKRSN